MSSPKPRDLMALMHLADDLELGFLLADAESPASRWSDRTSGPETQRRPHTWKGGGGHRIVEPVSKVRAW